MPNSNIPFSHRFVRYLQNSLSPQQFFVLDSSSGWENHDGFQKREGSSPTLTVSESSEQSRCRDISCKQPAAWRPGGWALGLAETVLWVPWGVGCATAGNLNLLDESQGVLSDVDQASQSLHWFLGRGCCIRKLSETKWEKTVCLERPITIVSEPAQGHSCWEGRVGAFSIQNATVICLSH